VPAPSNGEVEPYAVPSNGEPDRSALASNGDPERSASNGDPDRLRRVMALQNQLAALEFEPGPIDGRFGPVTMDAVRRLQEAHGLEADGIVGPLTAELLRQSAPEPPSNERAERIKALQHQLSWLGLEPGPADGRYGPLTTGAVRRFQKAHDLPVDGIVDRSTADALRASIAQRPSSNRIDRVSALQRQLVWLGLQPGPVDGRYGPRTAEAVMRFQEDHHLPADGVVGPDTQKALEESIQRTSQW
jgi:peptidoglycan hydrolase-like protein with peptidoglycan-binding domain